MTIKVLTDSTADLAPEDIAKYDIGMIPLHVHFGTETYLDKIDLTIEQFFAKQAQTKVNPTTSQPAAGHFIEFFEAALAESDLVVYIGVSEKLSGTFSSAKLAQAHIGSDRLLVIDSGNVTFSLGMIVIGFAKRKDKIKSKDEAIRLVEILKSEIKSYYIVDTMEYLIRGGRLSRVQGTIGGLLGIKPILTVKDGALSVVGKARGYRKAMDQVLELMAQDVPDHTLGSIGLFHALAPDKAEQFEAMLREKFTIGAIYSSLVGSVVGTHSGPGALAVAFFKDCQL